MDYRNAARVVVTQPIDLQPHTTLETGETGTVVRIYDDDGEIWAVNVLMDKFHKGLAEWNNEAHIAYEALSNIEPRHASLTEKLTAIAATLLGAVRWGWFKQV